MFSEGDYVCLREMTVGVGKCKKFRIRWKRPYLITKRFSNLNYQIQTKPGKYVTVNVNRMEVCYDPPGRRKTRKGTVPAKKTKQTDDDCSESDDEPLCILGRPKIVVTSQDTQDNLQNSENTDVMDIIDDPVEDDTNVLDTPNQEEQEGEERLVGDANVPRYYLHNRGGSQSVATPPGETREVTDKLGE
jgi:hypothetical protein